MIMSLAVQEKAQQAVGQLPDFARTRLLNASVQLVGPPSKEGMFDGSGVIVFVRTEKGTDTAWILTAKHNLYVWEDKTAAPQWTDDRVKRFAKAVRIKFGAEMGFGVEPDQVADIAEIVPVVNTSKDVWRYDVMVVKSTDPALVAHARANAVYLKPKDIDPSFLTKPLAYLRKTQDSKPVTFVQTGFGKIGMTVNDTPLPTEKPFGTNVHNTLQYRITVPLDKATTTVYSARGKGSDFDVFEEAILLRSSANDGTAPGDSGGPLYLVDPRDKKLQLIGVTTGGDLPTSKINPYPRPPEIAANNISTSLAVFYASILK